jgi:hypothetical protein
MRRDERSLFALARLLRKAERGAQLAQENNNDMKPTFGTIIDVDDPERRGRVRVVLDNMNPEFLTEAGFDQGESKATESDWIKPDTPFRGVQPEKLVGMRVPIKARDGDPNRLSFGSPIFDPEETVNQKKNPPSSTSRSGRGRSASGDGTQTSEADAEGEIPDNSDMVRCQVFPSGSLPDACQENHGCIVVEEDGPMECDWLCICAKRKGKFYWIRLVDLAHGHAGEDDGLQEPDTDGDGEIPVEEQTVWDYVFPTTHEEYQKQSIHGTDPRGNPEGDEAKWHGGA